MFLLVVALSPFAFGQGESRAATASSAPEEEIRKLENERLRVYQQGDKEGFDRIVAPRFTMTHSDGSVFERAQEMAIIKPAPPDKPYPPLVVEDARINVHGDAAVMTGLLLEKSQGGGRTQTVRLRFTNTYIKREGRWQIAAGQLTRLPQTHAIIKVNPQVYDAYVGQYELAPGRMARVLKEGDKLIAQLGAEARFELLPESQTQFFLEEADVQILFVTDEKGQATHLITRRANGEMLQARKVNAVN